MTRLSLILAATTAMCNPALAMDTTTSEDAQSTGSAHLSEAAETVENSASQAYETITEEASEAATAVERAADSTMDQAEDAANNVAEKVENAYDSAVESTKGAYNEAVETTEESLETLAARAEMGESRALTPIDLDNRSDFIRASQIIGAEIYTMETELDAAAWSATPRFTEISAEWESIGNIAELVVGPEGNLRGLIAEVGGFLGMGDAHVMIEMDDLRRTMPDDDGEFAFVTWMSEEVLEAKQPVEKDWWQ